MTLLRMAGRLAPWRATIVVVATVAEVVSTVISMIWLGRVVDALGVAPTADKVLPTVIIYVSLLLGAVVASAASKVALVHWQSAFISAAYKRFGDVLFDPSTVMTERNPESAARFGVTRQALDDWMFREALDNTITIWAARFLGLGSLLVVATWAWWPGLLLAVAYFLSSAASNRWSASVDDELLDLTGTDRRKATYFRGLLFGSAAASEMRIFGLSTHVLRKWEATWDTAIAAVRRERRSRAGPLVAATLGVFVVTLGCVALLVVDAWAGRLSAGTVITVVAGLFGLAAFGSQGDMSMSARHGNDTLRSLAQIERSRAVIVGQLVNMHDLKDPTLPSGTVVVEDVYFSWGSDRAVLAGISFTLQPGTSTALIGVNGAGKSTLVAALTGSVRPDSGRIRIGTGDAHGAMVQLAEAPVAAILQSYGRFPLTVKENITLGIDVPDEELNQVLADAGLISLISELSEGLDTMLGENTAGGVELSGGQWQRLALARALLRARSGLGLLILDEPTSAMDLETESRLFSTFKSHTSGCTTLTITHRLGSIRHHDRIMVMEGGRIIEDGSHNELVALSGRYSTLIALDEESDLV